MVHCPAGRLHFYLHFRAHVRLDKSLTFRFYWLITLRSLLWVDKLLVCGMSAVCASYWLSSPPFNCIANNRERWLCGECWQILTIALMEDVFVFWMMPFHSRVLCSSTVSVPVSILARASLFLRTNRHWSFGSHSSSTESSTLTAIDYFVHVLHWSTISLLPFLVLWFVYRLISLYCRTGLSYVVCLLLRVSDQTKFWLSSILMCIIVFSKLALNVRSAL